MPKKRILEFKRSESENYHKINRFSLNERHQFKRNTFFVNKQKIQDKNIQNKK